MIEEKLQVGISFYSIDIWIRYKFEDYSAQYCPIEETFYLTAHRDTAH
jgi:hypothetical protein